MFPSVHDRLSPYSFFFIVLKKSEGTKYIYPHINSSSVTTWPDLRHHTGRVLAFFDLFFIVDSNFFSLFPAREWNFKLSQIYLVGVIWQFPNLNSNLLCFSSIYTFYSWSDTSTQEQQHFCLKVSFHRRERILFLSSVTSSDLINRNYRCQDGK